MIFSAMKHGSRHEIPADLRARLETARLELLALFRALDRMDLSPAEIPQHLIRQLFQLDADYAEARYGHSTNPPAVSMLKPCCATRWLP